MSEWITAAQLAGLPGMPKTKSAVIRRAKAEGWTVRVRTARGGRVQEYATATLPAATRTALALRAEVGPEADAASAGTLEGAKLKLRDQMADKAAENRRLDALKQSAALPDADQRRIDAKLAILREVERFQRLHGHSIKKAEHLFAELYNTGATEVADWVRETVRRVSAGSLERWRLAVKSKGITALAGNYGNRAGDTKIDTQPELRALVVAILVEKPHARATHVMSALQARFGSRADIELPSKRSLERWIADWRNDNAQTLMALANPDAWKNRYMVAYGSASEGITRLNQRWEMDSTPADVMLADGRHSIIGVIDVYSRRLKLLVCKTSKAVAIADLIRRAMLEWGVPEEIKTDNGKDYTANHVLRVLHSLEIAHSLCPPFQPWRKPHIERGFGTFTRDLVELLHGFIGHNVAERKAIEARTSFADRLMQRGETVEIRLTAAEFQKFCDDWCDQVYAQQSHDGLGGRTPFEAVAGWAGPIRRIEDERALDILLAEAPGNNGMRTVQKSGIQLDNAWFIAPELEAYTGQQVQVLLLPDLGRIVVKGGPDLRFICIAECPERTGISRQEVAARAREVQKRRVQEERRALRAAAKTARTDDLVEEILRDRAQQAGKLAVFPKRSETHDTEGLRAAAEAAAVLHQPQSTTADLMSAEEFAIQRARLEAERQAPVAPVFETPFQRAYWLSEQGMKRDLTEEERLYLERYRKENPKSAKGLDDLLVQRFGAAALNQGA